MKILNKAVLSVLHRDKTLKSIMESNLGHKVVSNETVFVHLCRSIIAQQVSAASAKSVFSRFRKSFGGSRITPVSVLKRKTEDLRALGLSRQKAAYILNIAEYFDTNKIDRRRLRHMTDKEILDSLTQIKGVGEWTAQMVLIFALGRENVMPLGDVGIQLAMKELYNFEAKGKALNAKMTDISNAWSPYRSIGCLYMWQYRDFQKRSVTDPNEKSRNMA